jgi:2-beta-glucuronyltransferase
MPSAVILSAHDWFGPSQLNVHFIARALARAGWDVTFVLVRYGPRGILPHERPGELGAGAVLPLQGLPSAGGGSLAVAAAWHHIQGRPWVRAAARLAGEYRGGLSRPIMDRLRRASLLVFDSGEPLAFFEQGKRLNPTARFVFRMSDLPEAHGGSPRAGEGLEQALRESDIVAVPSHAMEERYRHLPNLRMLPHGIDPAAFDGAGLSPYPGGTRNAVYAGMHRLDLEALVTAARMRPCIRFHVFGPHQSDLRALPNVVPLGVRPFAETIPYVAHADIGLHPIPAGPGADSFSDSLKVIQYSYCRLPIVAPDFLRSTRPNVIPYTPGDEASIAAALDAALAFDRDAFVPGGIRTWDEVVAELLEAAGLA